MATQTIYNLLKYSRSYPAEDLARSTTHPTSYDREWQHFSNPKLQLFLDDVSPDGYFRSAKVKILWVPLASITQHVQQEPVVFLEDLALHSFSHVSEAPKRAGHQSPPLKVVYRDSVVGFRYLHPRVTPAGALPAYRRFQICFTDPLLATQFVGSIRRICPCKASLPSAGAPAQSTAANSATHTMPAPANDMHTATESFSVASRPHSLSLNASVLVNNLQKNHIMQPPSLLPAKDHAMQHNPDKSDLPLCRATTYAPDMIATPRKSCSLHVSQNAGKPSLLPTLIATSSPQRLDKATEYRNSPHHIHMTCSSAAVAAGINDPSTSSKHSTQGYITSSLENLAETASTTPNMTHSSNPTSKPHNQNYESSFTTPQALVPPDCLRDLCTVKELCALSMDQLEHLVGEVIREPEFLPLLEKLDVMWKVKGFITRTSTEYKP